jgi:hypothetical protein
MTTLINALDGPLLQPFFAIHAAHVANVQQAEQTPTNAAVVHAHLCGHSHQAAGAASLVRALCGQRIRQSCATLG